MQRPTHRVLCLECGESFSHPTLSDFAYGQGWFSTPDGRRHAQVNGLAEFPSRVGRFVEDDDFWNALARLADPIDGQRLVNDTRCPHCGSTNLDSWPDEQTGIVEVETVTFERATQLNDVDLAARINDKLTW